MPRHRERCSEPLDVQPAAGTAERQLALAEFAEVFDDRIVDLRNRRSAAKAAYWLY
jgi:hypothetical protein